MQINDFFPLLTENREITLQQYAQFSEVAPTIVGNIMTVVDFDGFECKYLLLDVSGDTLRRIKSGRWTKQDRSRLVQAALA